MLILTLHRLHIKGRNNIINLLDIAQAEILQVPVVDDEGQVVLDLYLFCHFFPGAEGFSHDCD
jgi:hypothetical protein